MQQKQIILVIGILVVLLVGTVGFTYLKRAELRDIATVGDTTPQETQTDPKRIDAKYFYSESDKLHTLAGEIEMPTPCDLLNYTPRVTEEGKRVVVAFTVVNNSGGVCAEMITPQRFKVSFTAEKDARIEATYEGGPAEFNLFPAAEGEDPENFELFIKG